MPKHYLLLLLMLCFTCCLTAQDTKQYAFTHHTVKNGLSSYHVTSVVQDEQGFIWIGTINGLQRFDGSRFVTFRRSNDQPNSLPDNYIVQLLLDKQHRLWVLLGNGKIGIFNTRRFTFKEVRLNVSDKILLKHTRRLVEFSDSSLVYTILHGEVLTYNKRTNEFSAAANRFKIPEGWRVASITEDVAAGKYWIAGDKGIAAYNKRTKTLSYKDHNTEQEPLIERHGSLDWLGTYKVDNKKRLWFLQWPPQSGDPVIFCYDTKTNKMLLHSYNLKNKIKKYIEPEGLLQQKDGSIWIRGSGVFARYIEEENDFQLVYNGYVNDQGISYDMITDLFEDREQNIWVATNNNGLYSFSPARQLFQSIKHTNRQRDMPGNGGLMSFANTNSGNILAGSWEDGFFMYDSLLRSVPLNISGADSVFHLSAWAMLKRSDSNMIWLSGQPAFIMLYDQKSNSIRKYEPPIFRGVTIRQLAEDKFKNVWLGTHYYGLFKWTAARATKKFEDGFTKIDGIPDHIVEKVLVDSKGYVWVGIRNHGVFKIDPATDSVMEHITADGPITKRLLNNDANSLLEYNDSIMLIGTGGLNVYNIKTNIITHITSSEGLPADMIVSIEKDRNGYVWMSLLNGLCRMNFASRLFTYYDRTDGIANDNFNVAASAYMPDGRMFFGTTDDFLVFNPEKSRGNIPPPNVVITDISINNEPVSVDSVQQLNRVELSPDDNSIVIGFSSLSYFKAGKLYYYYMLEGIDKEWRKTRNINQAVYNYLPSGKYTFKVKAETADGMSSINVTELKIKINPPFWQAWWFYCVLALITGGVIYWLDTERMNRKEAIQKMRSNIANNLHEDINTALNNINILSEIAKLKANKEPEKAIEYLEQIHSKSHNMIIALDDMLWSIDPQNDNMQKTIERMREFTDALKNRHKTQVDLLIDKKIEKLELNMKLRHEAFLLFKEIIQPVIQGGAQNCRIYISLEKLNIVYTIQFDNADTDMQQLSNMLQRDEMKAKQQEINATLHLQLYKNYSVIVLKIPVEQ